MGARNVENAVIAFVAAELNEKEERLRLTTRLYHDLGVDGDDADEFMQAFAERFKVDLSGFEFERHFSEEGTLNPLAYLWAKWRNPSRLKRIPITLEDLVDAADQKCWRTPERTPA